MEDEMADGMADEMVGGQRVVRLERREWILVGWNIILSAAIGFLALGGGGEERPTALVCESLTIVNAQGDELARLEGSPEEGGCLSLHSAEGERRAAFVGSREGGRVLLYREGARPAALLGVVEPGGPGLRLFSPEGWVEASFHSGERGPALSLHDSTVTRVRLDMPKDGPALRLYDATGAPRLAVSLCKGDPSLAISDTSGAPRAVFLAGEEGPALFTVDKVDRDDVPHEVLAPDMHRP